MINPVDITARSEAFRLAVTLHPMVDLDQWITKTVGSDETQTRMRDRHVARIAIYQRLCRQDGESCDDAESQIEAAARRLLTARHEARQAWQALCQSKAGDPASTLVAAEGAAWLLIFAGAAMITEEEASAWLLRNHILTCEHLSR